MFVTAIAILSFQSAVSNHVRDAGIASHEPSQSVLSASEVTQMSNDELIARLPPAAREGSRWDSAAGKVIHSLVVAEMRSRLACGLHLTDAQWRVALTRTGSFSVRDRWPAGEPLAVSIEMPNWLSLVQIRAVPRDSRLKSARGGMLVSGMCGLGVSMIVDAARYQELGRLPVGEHDLEFDVVVEQGRVSNSTESPAPGVLWEGSIVFHVTVVDDIDDVIPPARDPAIDRGVRDAIGVGVREAQIDNRVQRVVFVSIDPDVSRHSMLATTGLSLAIDVLRNGAVVQTVAALPTRRDDFIANCIHAWPHRSYASVNLDSVPADVFEKRNELAQWRLRVRGSSNGVLKLWDAKQRWAGEFTIDLEQLVDARSER